jgi:hypothetical protein
MRQSRLLPRPHHQRFVETVIARCAIKNLAVTRLGKIFGERIVANPRLNSISVGTNDDGRIEVFGLTPLEEFLGIPTGGGDAVHRWQTSSTDPSAPWSQDWESFGADKVLQCAAIRDARGRLELAILGSNGTAWKLTQIVPNGNWGGWNGLGGQQLGQVGLGNLQDGSLAYIVQGFATEVSTPQILINWNLRASPAGLGQFVAGNNQDGRLELFAIGRDRIAYHAWQTGGDWSPWVPLPSHDLKQLAVVKNDDGRLELFALGGDAAVYHIWQTVHDGNWGDWASLGGSIRQGTLAAIRDGSGRLQVFGSTGADLKMIGQIVPSGTFESDWTPITRTPGAGFDQVRVAIDRVGSNGGRLHVFGLMQQGTGTLSHFYQTTDEDKGNWSSAEVLNP